MDSSLLCHVSETPGARVGRNRQIAGCATGSGAFSVFSAVEISVCFIPMLSVSRVGGKL